MFTVRKSSQYSTRSINDPLTLCVPRTKRVTFQARSLPVAGAECWNSLPHYMRRITQLDNFKSQLKTYLFKLAYEMF